MALLSTASYHHGNRHHGSKWSKFHCGVKFKGAYCVGMKVSARGFKLRRYMLQRVGFPAEHRSIPPLVEHCLHCPDSHCGQDLSRLVRAACRIATWCFEAQIIFTSTEMRDLCSSELCLVFKTFSRVNPNTSAILMDYNRHSFTLFLV
ncbi:hypothetical protein CAPTEDRAFT_200454 [Capitella teleta]|uniref:Uncharacterized protein n=1 Tax=Capitella teleta TaxID=283909 RepID=R7TNW9_CAPTE|nr:hypothetical protein CAPTEDRAFT_200454 [Capitella teleta]|eukprot:ELT95588.1 hypothetical protein CAPTEDRAFT_200454 [Capitella teleta]